MEANTLNVPVGEISTSVVPVACTFALSLKLLTRVSPAVNFPTVLGTIATPYGLTSPFGGAVEPICTGSHSVTKGRATL
jgi:hypothetical protein